MSAEEALRMLGLSTEDFAEIKEASREICVCGHPKTRHYFGNEAVLCKPSKLECACGSYTAIIEAEDTRIFQAKTTGPRHEHALSKGIRFSAVKNKTIKWIDENYHCVLCQTKETLSIYAISGSPERGYRIAKDVHENPDIGRRNAMLCEACAETM